jgi:hypothetical protein
MYLYYLTAERRYSTALSLLLSIYILITCARSIIECRIFTGALMRTRFNGITKECGGCCFYFEKVLLAAVHALIFKVVPSYPPKLPAESIAVIFVVMFMPMFTSRWYQCIDICMYFYFWLMLLHIPSCATRTCVLPEESYFILLW